MADAAARRRRARRLARARRRRAVAAHPRRLLHHGDARLRRRWLFFVFHDTKLGGGTDGIFVYFKPEAMIGGSACSTSTKRRGLLLRRARRAGRHVSRCCALLRALALRARARRHPRQRAAACARARLPDLPLQARGLRDRRRAGRRGRLFRSRSQYGFVNPEMLGWHESGEVLLMIILGGIGHCAAPSSAPSRC